MSAGARERAAIAIHLVAIAAVLFGLDPHGTTLDRYHLVKEAVVASCAALLLGASLVRRTALDRVDLALVALVAVDLVGSVAAVDGELARRGALVTGALAALAIDLRGRSDRARALVATGAMALATLAAVATVAESYRLVPAISLPTYAPGGTIGQRNNAGHAFAIAIAAAAAMGLRAERRRTLVLCLVAIAPLAAALVLTRARAAWLAAIVGLAIALLADGRATLARRAARAACLLAVLALGASLPLAARPRLSWREAEPYAATAARLVDARTGSGRGRLVQWRTSLSLAREHPALGVGPGHWAVHYPRVAAPDDPTVHRDAWAPTSRLSTNDFVAWLVERGALGLLALLSLWLLIASRLARARDVPRLAALGALAVVSALDCVLQIALGAVVMASLAPVRDRVGPPPRGSAWALVIVALAMLGTPGALSRAWVASAARSADLAETEALARRAPSNVELRARLAEHALFAGDCEAARPWLDELAQLRPHHPRVLHDRALCAL